MSNPNLVMSPEDQEKALAWIRDKGSGGGQCSVCGNTSWALLDTLAGTQVFKEKSFHPGEGVAMLGIMCQQCGHMVYFNAVKIGLIAPSGKGEKDGQS